MRVFITGSAGFLGSWLTERLLEDGHDVVSIDNLIGGSLHNIISSARHRFVKADILDLEAMTSHMGGSHVVFHLAALAHEGLSVFSPLTITQNIVNGSVSVMTAAVRTGVRRFVNCSSVSRYGDNQTPFVETQLPKPQDPYGGAKVAAELQLNILGEIHGIEVVHAIPHNIIGPRQKYDDPFRNVAAIMINLMLQGRQPVIYGDGSQKRSFSYVGDVVDCLVKLIDCPLHEVGELFNIGPDEYYITVNELCQMIADLAGWELRANYVPERPAEVRFVTCSADKIRQRFGYRTTTSLEDGLRAMLSYIRKLGPLPFRYHLPLEIVNERTPITWREKSL